LKQIKLSVRLERSCFRWVSTVVLCGTEWGSRSVLSPPLSGWANLVLDQKCQVEDAVVTEQGIDVL